MTTSHISVLNLLTPNQDESTRYDIDQKHHGIPAHKILSCLFNQYQEGKGCISKHALIDYHFTLWRPLPFTRTDILVNLYTTQVSHYLHLYYA